MGASVWVSGEIALQAEGGGDIKVLCGAGGGGVCLPSSKNSEEMARIV